MRQFAFCLHFASYSLDAFSIRHLVCLSFLKIFIFSKVYLNLIALNLKVYRVELPSTLVKIRSTRVLDKCYKFVEIC